MKKTLSLLLCIVILCMGNLKAQDLVSIVTGKLIDDSNNDPIIGASIVIKGTTVGTTTDFDGNFNLNTTRSGNVSLIISFVGFQDITKEVNLNGSEISLGEMRMTSDAVGLAEVEVFASVAVDRKTPVAVSSVSPDIIEEKLGSQEFPEILKSTPGVYVTKQGGGFGDSRINMRGFKSENVAVMINGVPVNDMENGRVFWSNWVGLADVTRSMQSQRGLGASKVAVPSVGGTINILTKTTDAQKGGQIYLGIGNNNYSKIGVTASTGQTDNKWAMTVSLARTAGNGWADATSFLGWSYFFNVSKVFNPRHTLAFTLFGAPQWHGQRSSRLKIEDYVNAERETRYNPDWGYKAGQETNVTTNFYHKPQASLNWYFTINNRIDLSTAAYVSTGTGGGSGSYGDRSKLDFAFNNPYRLYDYGPIDMDLIVDENQASVNGSETILRASRNDHTWAGLLSTVNAQVGDYWNITGSLDFRYYKGEHFREVTDLLGGDFYIDRGQDVNDLNKVVRVGDKIDYNNDGLVHWEGLFAQGEYNKDKVSAFVALSFSSISYKRIDYFNYLEDGSDIVATDPYYQDLLTEYRISFDVTQPQKTDWVNFLGWMAKGGVNYRIDDKHNVFANVGYFERQPFFNSVFLNFRNEVNDDAVNEKILSFELGYGFRSQKFSLNLNAYYTSWKDKSFTSSIPLEDGSGESLAANILGIDALHTGIELDMTWKPFRTTTFRGMFSLGDWRWVNDLDSVAVFDDTQTQVGTIDKLFIKDVHVGDAAQTTAAVGWDQVVFPNFKIGVDYNFYSRLFADFDPTDRTDENDAGVDSWQVPSYHLVDLSAKFDFDFASLKSTLYFKVNNIGNVKYVSDAQDGNNNDAETAQVYFGLGTTWSGGLRIRF